MIRLKRRNTAWLVAMGLIIALALFTSSVSAAATVALLGIFAIAMAASMVEIGRDRETLIDALRRAPIRQRVSPQAKEAQERAKSQGGYVNNRLLMLDLGVIASQTGHDGMAMRRTRSTSKDDDAIRPFITLYVEPEEAERSTVIRFEVYNQHGEREYVHEMRPYLREGELTIMADYQLPLSGNKRIAGAGDWDLRVLVDGNLVGVHNFTLAPSIAERTRRLAGNAHDQHDAVSERYRNFDIIEEEPQEIPPSLQDLLQGDGERSTSRRTSPTTRRRRS